MTGYCAPTCIAASPSSRNLTFPSTCCCAPSISPHVPRLSERLPRLRMVIDHIAKPHIRDHRIAPWASGLKAAAENPNVWCKLSGMITEASHTGWTADDLAPYVHTTLAAFGLERVMYGSDWPVCTLAGSYEQVIGALRDVLGESDPRAESLIFGGAALKFYQPPNLGSFPTADQQEASA